MHRSAMFFAALLAQHVCAASQDGQTWTFENRSIRVRVDAASGALSVHDKRVGRDWLPAVSKPPAPPKLAVARATRLIRLDGDLADWPAGGTVRLTPDMVADAAQVDDAQDASAVVHICHRDGALFVAVEVADDRLRLAKPDEAQWWLYDSVELWVGRTQIGLRLSDGGVTVWSRSNMAKRVRAVMQRTPKGYVVEASVPGAATLGKQLRFALGDNDSDKQGGQREGQLYYPSTWKHSAPNTFAMLDLVESAAKPSAPAAARPKARLREVEKLVDGRTGIRCLADCATSGGHTVEAKRWIPKGLEKYPYNARFLDVTTATGLRECYSPTHGQTRKDDRLAKRALAQYVGDDLGLVLGGEHGRWWGADVFDYWEGMQSGGFYSWPAGHVGKAIPEKREGIGKRYLEWGLGHAVRVPLWELVFGDCVVCTWYWGDSTGHLYQAAPELAAKKDAFNILYATVPLYWVSRPYSFNWSDPDLRARLMESYRNTCKLHAAERPGARGRARGQGLAGRSSLREDV